MTHEVHGGGGGPGGRLVEVGILGEIARMISASTRPDDVGATAVSAITKTVAPDLVLIFERQGNDLVVRHQGASDNCLSHDQDHVHKVGHCLCGLAVKRAEPIYALDILEDDRCTWSECKNKGIRSFAALPLRHAGQVLGVLSLASLKPRDFGDQALFLEALADSVAVSWSSARMIQALEEQIHKSTRSEKKARENEKRLTAILDNAPVGIFQSSMQGRYLSANDCLARMYGYNTPQQLMHEVTSIADQIYVDPEDRFELMRRLQAQGAIFNYESRRRKRSGEVIWTATNMRTVRDRQGGIAYIEGFSVDITERKQAEKSLQESEERFRRLLDNAPDMIFRITVPGGTYEYVSPSSLALTGYSPEEIMDEALQVRNVIHPDWREYLDEQWDLVCKGLGPETFEFQIVDKKGRMRWMNQRNVYIRDERGNVVALEGIITDITKRKLAEEALRQEMERTVFHEENSPLAIIEWDKGTRIKKWSSRAEDFFGWTAEEVMGKNWADFPFVHPEDEHMVNTRIGKLFSGEQSANTTENRNLRKDGGVVHCQWHNSALRDAKGRMLSLFSQAADVTELKTALEKLSQARDDAEAASRAKDEFLANMSHELRTPLNGILGMLQLMETTDMDGEQEEYVISALQSSKRLNRLLSDILDLSRVEAGKLSIQEEPMDLFETMHQVEELFSPMARQTDIALSCHVDPDIPAWMLGDAARLQQILSNLVGNAFKFTHEGAVVMEAYPLPAIFPGTHRVLFAVSDTGIGIAEEKLHALFEPFTQAGEGYTRQYQGAGLGLSICKRLVDLMGGAIHMESEKGHGTTVYFCLEFRAVERPEHQASGLAPAPEKIALRVLLAEDDRVSSFTTKRQLEKTGCQVTVAADGGDVLDALNREDFDVVLMDVQMPVMDGVEATRAIRSGEAGTRNADMPIVALTAYAMTGDRERFMQAGMDGYLAKPVDFDELAEVLSRFKARRP